jgi:hypothetical protein
MRRLLPLLLVVGCASTQPRFRDAPVVWAVDDRATIPPPEENDYYRYPYMADVFLFRAATRALELHDTEPAWNTNALDEVPASSWFTPRAGYRPLSPAAVARGPDEHGAPEPPLVIFAGKSAGGNPGFFVKDRRGVGYLIKFDPKDSPEIQTATDAIVSRLFWALGYNVPADHVFTFARGDVSVGEGAKRKDDLGRKVPLTDADLDAVLATAPRRPDGRYRALASTFLAGRPLGGAVPEGVRDDDPNDTVPHEHRRELRGLRVFAAWLNHTDMKEDNTLDMYVEEDGRRFVKHHLVDFGEAFAAHAAEKGRREDGYEHFWDWWAQPVGLVTLGLWVRPWEQLEPTRWLAVGTFAAEPFEPWAWKEAYPFWPFREADLADLYWGAKLVMHLERAHLEAAVAAGQLSHPDAAAYLVDVLLQRREAIGRAFLEAVSPLDAFQISGRTLCGVDQSVRFGLVSAGLVEVLDDADVVEADASVGLDGRFCVPVAEGPSYRIVRLRVKRGPDERPVMQVHLRDDARGLRISGLIRVEENPAEPPAR